MDLPSLTEVVPDGVLVKIGNRTFFVSDHSLATSIGLPMYLAFYTKITSRHETYSPSDFDPNIIKAAQTSTLDLDKSLNILANYPTTSYIRLWRKLKEIHALIISTISAFPWNDHQEKSVELVGAPSISQYLENSLNYIAARSPSSLTTYLIDQFRYLQPLFPDHKVVISFGILPATYVVNTEGSRQLTESLNSSSSGIWLTFWIVVIGVILVALLLWATRRGFE